MASQTITAMFGSRSEAEQAAESVRRKTTLGGTTVRVLPENETETTVSDTGTRHDTGFLAALRNLFMPEEDRYGYAEGMRRGGYMVAVDTDEAHAHEVMDLLEQSGAVDLDAQEAQWRQEGWRGYEPSASATAGANESTSALGVVGSGVGTGTEMGAGTGIGTGSTAAASREGTRPSALEPGRSAGTGRDATREGLATTTAGGGTEERIPLAEETLRVGKRQVVEGRVRIRSYVVETPVSETVHLRDEHVQVERRPVDRPVTGDADPFREREIEATESHEEAVVSKDARVREELVMRRTTDEHDETVKDTVRRTEVREDRGDDAKRDPDATRTP